MRYDFELRHSNMYSLLCYEHMSRVCICPVSDCIKMVGTTDVDFSISMLLPGLQLLNPVNVQVFTEQTDEQTDG